MNDDDIDIGLWLLAMPMAIFGFFCLLYVGATENKNDLFRQNVGFIVLTVALWFRFHRLEKLIGGKR